MAEPAAAMAAGEAHDVGRSDRQALYVPVVVLHWGPAALTVRCIESLRDASWPGRRTVLVIDNTGRFAESDVRHIRGVEISIQRPAHNLGFARGCTLGISIAMAGGADYILLVNNDVVVSRDFLDPLLCAADAMPDAGLLSPQVLRMDDARRAWYLGGTFSLWTGIPTQANRRPAMDPTSPPCDVDYATGCAMLIRPAVIERIGSFDPRLFAYCEDVDLSIRARQVGFRVVFVPGSIVHHEVNREPRRVSLRIYYTTRNLLELMRKHAAWYMWPSFAISFLTRWLAFFAALAVLRGQPRYLLALAQGIFDFAANKFEESGRVRDERATPATASPPS